MEVEPVVAGRDDRADDRDPEQAGDPRDRVVHAARDARLALAGIGEHGGGERGDDHRQADGEDEEWGQELQPVVEARSEACDSGEPGRRDQRPDAHEDAWPDPHRESSDAT